MVKKVQLFSEQVSDKVYALLILYIKKIDQKDVENGSFACVFI